MFYIVATASIAMLASSALTFFLLTRADKTNKPKKDKRGRFRSSKRRVDTSSEIDEDTSYVSQTTKRDNETNDFSEDPSPVKTRGHKTKTLYPAVLPN